MMRTTVRGAVVVAAAFAVAVAGPAIGLETVWPLLLALAVGWVAPLTFGTAFAFVAGAGAGWLAIALRAGVLPDSDASVGIAMAVAAVTVTVVAAASRERAPMWAGLAGASGFLGLYEPTYADSPTLFLTDSPVALATVLVAAAIGALMALLVDAIVGATEREADVRTTTIDDIRGEVAPR